MSRFIVLDLSLELITELAPQLRTLRPENPSLFDQLNRACVSIASNLAEGRRRVGKDRAHFFRTAEGSAAEVQIQLKICVARGDLTEEQLARSLQLADRITGMCYGLTRDRSRGG